MANNEQEIVILSYIIIATFKKLERMKLTQRFLSFDFDNVNENEEDERVLTWEEILDIGNK